MGEPTYEATDPDRELPGATALDYCLGSESELVRVRIYWFFPGGLTRPTQDPRLATPRRNRSRRICFAPYVYLVIYVEEILLLSPLRPLRDLVGRTRNTADAEDPKSLWAAAEGPRRARVDSYHVLGIERQTLAMLAD